MSVTQRNLHFLATGVIALAALLAVLPLWVQGCSCGHDFDFHLLSWMEAASQWQHGILKPVWAFTPAYNAGEPRLLFYPPLSWATGAFLGLFLPWPFVPIAFTWLVLLLSGLTMRRLLMRWTSPTMATLGSCLYLVNPYMLFCAYERTAYAELMSAAWMPLLLAALLRPRVSLWRIALPVALLWLTNAPSAVVGSYSVLFFGVLRLLAQRRRGMSLLFRTGGVMAGGVLLAFLLDAFYLVPLAAERGFVQLALAVVPIARPDHNFLFAYDKDAFHTHVLVQASWIAIGTITVAVLSGASLLLRSRNGRTARFASMHERDAAHIPREAVVLLTSFSVVVLLLLLPLSAPFWQYAPQVVFLQFPWRFLTAESAVAVTLLILVLHYVLSRASARIVLPTGVLAAATAGWFAGGMYFREECDATETVQAQRDQFIHRDGVDPTDEYTPAIADNDELHLHLPPAWMADEPDADPPGTVSKVSINSTHPENQLVTMPALGQRLLVVRLRKFPGWHVLRDGVEIDPATRDDGLMVIPVTPAQPHRIALVYRTTRDQWAGLAGTGTTLLGLLATGWRRRFGMMKQP